MVDKTKIRMAKILLIDDEEGMRSWTAQFLRTAGHEVVTAKDGVEGTEVAVSNKFDLVITDIIMPEKEGLETIMDLRKNDASIPIIAISGGGVMSSFEVLDMARSFGAVATLDKPFSGQLLLKTVDKALGKEEGH